VFVHDDTTAAAIYEGALVVGSNGVGFPVYDATAVTIRKGAIPEKSHGIPGTPSWPATTPPGTTPPLALVRSGQKAQLGFAWTPVQGATAYRVEVSTDAVMVNVVKRETTTQTTFSVGEVPAGGRFWVRVRAIVGDGIVGGWSKPRPLRVLRLTYPERAIATSDGAVILPEDEALGLADAEGIEVAYEPTDGPKGPLAWTKAPTALRLGPTGGRIVHVRDATLGVETRLVLGRRELRARVEMCPKRARWPEDTLTIRATVSDPSARIDASNEALTFETTVNLEPIAVTWHHVGTTWWATVPPRAPPGPWVVRVTARDSAGNEIGWGGLEVEGKRMQFQPSKHGAPDTTEVRVSH
jgi:hypothetical protein